jgi:hypothetical protein
MKLDKHGAVNRIEIGRGNRNPWGKPSSGAILFTTNPGRLYLG